MVRQINHPEYSERSPTVMYPPVSILLDLQRPATLHRIYDNPTVISTEPRLPRVRQLAGHLASLSLPRPRPRQLPWRAAPRCDQLASRA
jgi:hypothetical protein